MEITLTTNQEPEILVWFSIPRILSRRTIKE